MQSIIRKTRKQSNCYHQTIHFLGVFLFFAVGFAALDSAQAAYSVYKLTNNSYDDSNPRINDDGDIAWQGSDGNDDEIFFYDSSSGATIQISNNTDRDYPPQINNNGDVVWSGNGIFLYKKSTGVTTKIADNGGYSESNPR